MLVLAVTFQSKPLSWLVTKDDLLALLNKTIDFPSSLSLHYPSYRYPAFEKDLSSQGALVRE